MSISRLSRARNCCVTILAVIVFMACNQKPLIVSFDDSEWHLVERSYTITSDTAFVTFPVHSGSWSLYAGYTADTLGVLNRESVIVMRFSSVETTRFSERSRARLRLFRRAWDEDPVDLADQTFELWVVDTSGTQWNENKLGWTLDSLTYNYVTSAQLKDTLAQVWVDGGVDEDSLREEQVEFLEFPIDSLSNEGFIIRMASLSHLATFHSRHDISPPYLLIDYPADTTDTDTIEASQQYIYPAADLSLYPSTEEYLPSLPAGLVALNRSDGASYHISVSDLPFMSEADPISLVTGRIILYVDRTIMGQTWADVSLLIYERPDYFSVSDSITPLVIIHNAYSKGADSLIIPLGSGLLNKYVIEPIDGGLDFVVAPQNHDFDRLYFWGATAPDSLRPRLEIIYNDPYGEGNQ